MRCPLLAAPEAPALRPCRLSQPAPAPPGWSQTAGNAPEDERELEVEVLIHRILFPLRPQQPHKGIWLLFPASTQAALPNPLHPNPMPYTYLDPNPSRGGQFPPLSRPGSTCLSPAFIPKNLPPLHPIFTQSHWAHISPGTPWAPLTPFTPAHKHSGDHLHLPQEVCSPRWR